MWHEHEDVPYQAVFAATPAPLLVLTPDLVIREANDAYLKAVDRCRDELVGRHMFDVFPRSSDSDGDGVANLRASLERARDTGRPDTMAIQRYDIPRRDGTFEERYWSAIQVPVLDADGATMLLLHRAEDVTDFVRERQLGERVQTRERVWRRRMQEAETDLFARARELQALNEELRLTRDQLALRALRDPLTDLLIRPVLVEQVERALSRTARRPLPVSVLFVDLDRLKQVNDGHGHAAGDSLIRCFAKQLQSNVRPGDAVARFGGDEFVVLLEDLNGVADAEAVAQRVLAAARDCPLPSDVSMRPSASVGVAVAWGADVTAEELIAQADQAMYRAKRTGGGCYQVFDPVVQASPDRQPPGLLGRAGQHALDEVALEGEEHSSGTTADIPSGR